jgi:hypothetical protein
MTIFNLTISVNTLLESTASKKKVALQKLADKLDADVLESLAELTEGTKDVNGFIRSNIGLLKTHMK